MSKLFPGVTPVPKSQDDDLQRTRQGLRLVRSGLGVASEIKAGNPAKAVEKAIIAGMKLAENQSPFYNPNAPVLQLVHMLQNLGISALTWTPETLCAEIDRRYGAHTDEQVNAGLQYFHDTGILQTEVPLLVRQKLYAIRIVATSDTAQTEWNIFEKVGGAFNGRVANFSMSEPLNAAECAATIALINTIRPDSYTNEIQIYVAAACHQDGLYTVAPIKELTLAEGYLQQMNSDSTAATTDPAVQQKISELLKTYTTDAHGLHEAPEDMESVQALRLLAIQEYVKDALVRS